MENRTFPPTTTNINISIPKHGPISHFPVSKLLQCESEDGVNTFIWESNVIKRKYTSTCGGGASKTSPSALKYVRSPS